MEIFGVRVFPLLHADWLNGKCNAAFIYLFFLNKLQESRNLAVNL